MFRTRGIFRTSVLWNNYFCKTYERRHLETLRKLLIKPKLWSVFDTETLSIDRITYLRICSVLYVLMYEKHAILISATKKKDYKSILKTEAVVRRCSVRTVFLKNLQNSQENTSVRVSFLWHRCFPVNFAKCLRAPISIEHLWWLLR